MVFNFDEFMNEGIKLSKIAKREEFMGYQILIGRNAEMNDILTTQIANEEDIFFHASGVPGSHVIIIKKENEEVPKEVIQRAAELAAVNSRGKGQVRVVWTKAKYVTKDKSQKMGEVYVDYDKSHFIKVTV